ncbi:UNVERIFIED_CONTAM: Eukaryotic translation initiation factor 2D [Sesamum radiatum]|uniref:Eukaryotic translation initiation factor 2D n=1 Tax=Sesamum radiatum TaxID=300843 RepID=A0AAW2M5K7_SESRA
MFKKAVEPKSQQRLSGADRKKLKRAIRDRFRNASDPHIDLLLPPKVEITVSKYPNRVLVYGLEGDCPMFYDGDGRGSEIFPTVYALWKVPDLLPAFTLKGGEVSRFVLGGADLMFPGIQIPAEGLPSFSAGEPWAVKVPGNPAPIAVGTTTMSSTEALKAGLRGKALRISHYYLDTLWYKQQGLHLSNLFSIRRIPDMDSLDNRFSYLCLYSVIYFPGNQLKIVMSQMLDSWKMLYLRTLLLCSASQASDLCQDDSSAGQTNAISNEHIGDSSSADGTPSIPYSASVEYTGATDEVSEQITTAMVDLQVVEDAAGIESNVDDQHLLSVEDVDALLDKCLLQALHTTVKDKDLPMPGSILWSSHVLPCRPSGITLDIKKSSYKKLAKWLQSKSASGLISVKEDKHKKEVTLSSVNRNHLDYTSFKPEKKKVEKNEQSTKNNANEGQLHKLLDVVEIYKPTTHVNPIFAAIGADTGKLYSAPEASQIVFGYIEKEKLVKQTDKSIVVLDATLCDALFKGAIKKGSMQGNKKVTKLSGLESFLIDAEILASELQKKFACSTTISELPGKKGLEVLVQGGVIDDLARHLVEQYGVQKRFIEVLDKTKR